MGVSMAYKQQQEILKQGVEAWNSWRRDNPDVKIDLSEAKLLMADLPMINAVRTLKASVLAGQKLAGRDT